MRSIAQLWWHKSSAHTKKAWKLDVWMYCTLFNAVITTAVVISHLPYTRIISKWAWCTAQYINAWDDENHMKFVRKAWFQSGTFQMQVKTINLWGITMSTTTTPTSIEVEERVSYMPRPPTSFHSLFYGKFLLLTGHEWMDKMSFSCKSFKFCFIRLHISQSCD